MILIGKKVLFPCFEIKKKDIFSSGIKVKLLVWLYSWVSSGSNVFYIHSRRLTRCHIESTCCSLVIIILPTSSCRGCWWLRWICLISFIPYGNLVTWTCSHFDKNKICVFFEIQINCFNIKQKQICYLNNCNQIWSKSKFQFSMKLYLLDSIEKNKLTTIKQRFVNDNDAPNGWSYNCW